MTVLILSRNALLLATMWPLTAAHGLVGAAIAVLASDGLAQVMAIGMTMSLLTKPFGGMSGPTLAIFFSGAAGGVVGVLAGAAAGGVFGLPLAVIAGLGLAGFTLWRLDRVLRLGLLDQLVAAFPGFGRAGRAK